MIYSFPSGMWSSFDATYFMGGRTTINGARGNDLQQNWRLGATLASPIDIHNSIKLYASSGVSHRTGNSFDLLGITWQYRWGGGLRCLRVSAARSDMATCLRPVAATRSR